MRYYPVNLDIRGKNCLVVGAGKVGARKALALIRCGAFLTVVSPGACEKIRLFARENKLTWKKKKYESSDIKGMFLVIGASDNEKVNKKVADDARRLGILCNIADRPEDCGFTLPAFIERGALVITVSTSGNSPALARKIRKDLEKKFGDEYEKALIIMGKIRKKLLKTDNNPERHKKLFRQILDKGMIDMIKHEKTENLDRLIIEIFGKGFKLSSL